MSFSEWKEYKLEDVTINYNSKRVPLSSKERELRQGKYPYYGAQGVIDFIDKFILEGQYLLVAEDGANLETRNEDIARLTKNQEQFWVNNHAHILRSNENSDIRYIKYFLNKSDLSGYITGSAQPKLNKANLNSIRMVLPPFEEQKAIAHILSTLDDKIEVNNQINKTLENMAQTIFKQWFVDFEFPNEDEEPYKSSGGEMVESELGMIPKGWEVVKLETVCREITRGFTSKYVEKSRFKNLNQKVNKGEVLEKQYYKFLREDIEIPQNKFVKKYDILLNSLGQGTLGRLHFFIEDEENVVIDQHITIIRADHETSFDSYLYHLLSSSKYTQIFDGLVSGSTGMQMLNISKVRSLTVCMPPVDLQKDFDNRIKTLYKKKEVLLYENEYLKLIRDSLLPKLMSGEIRVPLDKEGDAS